MSLRNTGLSPINDLAKKNDLKATSNDDIVKDELISRLASVEPKRADKKEQAQLITESSRLQKIKAEQERSQAYSDRSKAVDAAKAILQTVSTPHPEADELVKFYQSIPADKDVLVVVGGGTAALTYLYTQELESKYSHIVILGDRGYWGVASHRLAQPHHILALPHERSHDFIDPAEHDAIHKILPHEDKSAYVHSRDYQSRLVQLEDATVKALIEKGKKVFVAKRAQVKQIERGTQLALQVQIDQINLPLIANKVIMATGAGPARKLAPELQKSLDASAAKLQSVDPKASNDPKDSNNNTTHSSASVDNRIFNYTDTLTSVSENAKGQDVIIYGGGATAAWAAEVAQLKARKLVAWIAKSGFDEAINAGPRVGAILDRTKEAQIQGKVDDVRYVDVSGQRKLAVTVSSTRPGSATPPTEYIVDYLFNCIGQEQYEKNEGGLPEILREMNPYLDINNVSGQKDPSMLGWKNNQDDVLIIGAAQGTYYHKDKKVDRGVAVSSFIPRSGQVPITIGGVVSTVCAMTNYMPVVQDPETREISLVSLNLHVMNATQLAAYFSGLFPRARAVQVSNAVTALISARSQTEFGLSDDQLENFMKLHFPYVASEKKSSTSAAIVDLKAADAKAQPVRPLATSQTAIAASEKDAPETEKQAKAQAKQESQKRNFFFVSAEDPYAVAFVSKEQNDEVRNDNVVVAPAPTPVPARPTVAVQTL
jgi:hypothetical protein